MPAETTPCVLDEGTKASLLEIIDALSAEGGQTIEVDGGEIDLKELRGHIASCATEMPKFKMKKKRGPKEPSAYNKFIGHCRTSPEKGGLGKDFTECVRLWKEQKK